MEEQRSPKPYVEGSIPSSPAIKDMLFAAPNLHLGINTTIRKGRKWYDVKIGDEVCLREAGEWKLVLGFGRVVGVRQTIVGAVTQDELEKLACKVPDTTVASLYSTLRGIYRNFTKLDKILVISFELII